MLIHRDIFLEVGGFDESFFAYFEDVDLGWRLWLMGYRVVASLAIAIEWLSGNRARPQFQDWHQARLSPCIE